MVSVWMLTADAKTIMKHVLKTNKKYVLSTCPSYAEDMSWKFLLFNIDYE